MINIYFFTGGLLLHKNNGGEILHKTGGEILHENNGGEILHETGGEILHENNGGEILHKTGGLKIWIMNTVQIRSRYWKAWKL